MTRREEAEAARREANEAHRQWRILSASEKDAWDIWQKALDKALTLEALAKEEAEG